MNAKQFRKYLDRDFGCVHCGDVETAVPHHRLNRGMGGSKSRNRPSNILSLCAVINGLLEADPKWARLARDYGWKLREGEHPDAVAVWYPTLGQWCFLDDLGNRVSVTEVAS